jgi:catechol 2,3-dioxygenase
MASEKNFHTHMNTAEVNFKPRRLGHVNLWVGDLEKAVDFYESVCGIELVRRERNLLIAFHSNGNTHHDIGVIEISRGKDRYGRDGSLQIPRTRGTAPGLNHLGWEMENEVALVDAYHRARAIGFPVQRAMDHLISHSLYVNDPDGNGHEFYADALSDWRSIYNLEREDEVTGDWDPLANPPRDERNYDAAPSIGRVARAPVHPSYLAGVSFATRRFDEMERFFTSVAGLHVVSRKFAPVREAWFAGGIGRVDLKLREASAVEPTGLASFLMQLAEEVNVPAMVSKLRSEGIDANAQGSRLVLKDPDGFTIEFQSSSA